MIAEGIETQNELSSLISMGMHYGQGYHIARPQRPKPEVRLKIRPAPKAADNKWTGSTNWKCSIPVRAVWRSPSM